MQRTVIVDFETKGIEPRPSYPPLPVGVAIMEGSHKQYLAWGHPTKNNSNASAAHGVLRDLWRDKNVDLVFHNGKFDLDVAEKHFDLKLPPWQRCHDTLFLIYLDDPRAVSLSLKPSAERLLRMPPEEQDAVREWLIAHGVVKANDKHWGAHIADAPGDVVGRYAIGDVVRTKKLFELLMKSIAKRGMIPAYERERRLMPILLENERIGIRMDHERLRKDVKRYTAAQQQCDDWIRKVLKSPNLDIDSDDQLAAALDKAKMVKDWTLTPGGKRSTSKKNLKVKNPQVTAALAYRGMLSTYLGTFMGTWLASADETGGVWHPTWNQVRGENDKGTRTGRMSASLLMNIPKPAVDKEGQESLDVKLDGIKLPNLPRVRSYILGDTKNDLVGSVDYSQQELRALGHFEDGPLLEAYLETPRMDLHDHATKLVNELLNSNYARKPIKNLAFGLIYGMGIPKTAAQMGVDEDTARRIKDAYLSIFPGLSDLIKDLKLRAKLGLPIKTWGGREYYCEPPKLMTSGNRKGQMMSFEYKMLNVLIQGSSADCTKEAMIRYHKNKIHGRFLAQVHDQILISAPKHHAADEVKILAGAMESVEFDVPMLTDMSIGPNWADLKDIK